MIKNIYYAIHSTGNISNYAKFYGIKVWEPTGEA